MSAQMIEPRNRIYRDLDTERRAIGMIPMTDLYADRLAYAETRGPFEATPNPGNGLYLGGDDGEPTSGGETAAIIGVIVCCCLLLAGLAYLAWSGAHGGFAWTR